MENLVSPVIGRPLMSPVELQAGIASLSRGAYFKEAPLDMMLSILTEATAQMSGVERVSIWALNNEQKELLCLDIFEMSSQRHGKGEILYARQYPTFFRALHLGTSILADDVTAHPITAEISAGYLQRYGVTAILDTPIHIRGELQGVLCLEQVGPAQPWNPAHALFAQAVANLVTLALVENEAEEARRQAHVAAERLRAAYKAPRDARVLSGYGMALEMDH